jgi:hypothetical protein
MKVSMVCPTYDRARYMLTALRCFLQQTYWNKELIIIDDGYSPLDYPVFVDDSRVKYIHLGVRTATGTKRNIGIDAASGDVIANMDDDDWSSAHRIEDEVRRLVSTGKAVTGYNSTVVYDEATGLLYKNLGGPPYFASGTSQCYFKEWWTKHPYPDVSYGEDSVFSRTARLSDQLSIADVGKMMVARKHSSNTDFVAVKRLKPIHQDDVSKDVFPAFAAPNISYPPTTRWDEVKSFIQEPHVCSEECKKEAEQQFNSPVVDAQFHADWLPEIVTR